MADECIGHETACQLGRKKAQEIVDLWIKVNMDV